MNVPIRDCSIIGGHVPPNGKACFAASDVVVRHPGGIMRVRGYVGDEATGEPYSEEDWQALLADEQATALCVDFCPCLFSGTVIWALRSNFLARDDAHLRIRTSGALHHDMIEGPNDSMLFLLHAKLAQPLRQELTELWYLDGVKDARGRLWEAALMCAEQAFCLASSLAKRETALLVLAYEKNGRPELAAAYLKLASCDAELARLRQELKERP